MSTVTKNEYYEDQAKFREEIKGSIPSVQNATVIELTRDGEPILQFIGEKKPRQKIYRHYESYTPRIGDRVQLLNGVIQGGWKP